MECYFKLKGNEPLFRKIGKNKYNHSNQIYTEYYFTYIKLKKL